MTGSTGPPVGQAVPPRRQLLPLHRSRRVAAPVALYVHFPFCVSLCPYCDFVVVAGAEARGPANRIAAFVAALRTEIGLRADALDERWAVRAARPTSGAAGRRSARSTSAAARPRSCPPTRWPGSSSSSGERFGLAPGAEVTLEANPGPDERGDAVAQQRAGVTRLSLGAQSEIPSELRRLGPPPPAGRRRRRGRRGPRRRHRLGQPRPALRHPGADHRDLDGLARRGAGPRSGPPLAVRAHPRRPRRRGPHRAGRRPPAHHAGARAAGATRRGRPRTTTGRPRCTTTRSCASPRTAGAATRSATGPGPDTRAATTWPTGSACRTRRWVPAPTRSTGAPGAGTRPVSMPTWRRCSPPDASAPAPPAGRRRDARRGDRRSRDAHPRPAHGRRGRERERSPIRSLADTLAWARELELVTVDPRRPGPPHDPRPAALQRAVRPARLRPPAPADRPRIGTSRTGRKGRPAR